MTTHFHPLRASIPRESSPNRPSTSHSTIRTVTPSPPQSRHAGFTFYIADSSECIRPKSDSFISPQSFYFGDDKPRDNMEIRPVPQLAQQPGNNKFSNLPTLKTQFPNLRNNGVMSERSSPTGSRVPLQEPQKRPLSTPPRLPSHEKELNQEDRVSKDQKGKNQEAEKSDSSSDEHGNYPDTPTPIPRSQKRSAFLPLQSPPSPILRNRQKESPERLYTSRTSRDSPRNSRTGSMNSRTPRYSTFPMNTVQNHHQARKNSLHNSPNFPTQAAPPYATYNRRRQKSLPLSPPTRNVSFNGPNKHTSVPVPSRNASLSARSHLSTATAASHRTIFSTPGRDEMERKKTIVELDEGPFGRVTTVADLRKERNAIMGIKKKDKKEKSATRKVHICGLGLGRCSVM